MIHARLICTVGIALIFAAPVFAVPPAAVPQGAVDDKATQDARNAIKSFKLSPGIVAELFATEPLLANPVAFTVDEKGRWYIAETYRQERGVEDNRALGNWLNDDIAARSVEDRLAMIRKFYPDPKKFAEKFTKYEDRITRVEDSNGDGVADKSTVFADGFRDPLDGTGAGIIARGGDIWWTCIPHLWRFRDVDGDGKAELKEKLLSGFGVKFAFRGHDMHGLRFGPDGKLYFSIGDRGINVTSKEGKTFVEPDTGSIMRCNPDGSGFEVFATGVRNPQELAFDEFGNLFTGDNNSDAGDQARFVHLVEGGDSGWRMTFQYLNDRGPWNREKLWDAKASLKAKYLIPPIANIGSGPSGLTYNPGTGLSPKHQRRFFMSDFRGGATASVVHEIELQPSGAGFGAKHRDFVKGVLTTDCEFGPDGALYVLDWVESWGGVNKGRIYRLRDSGADAALQSSTRKLIEDGMSKRGEAELVQLLRHPDMRVRQASQFELAAKGPASLGALTKLAGDAAAPQLARLHAIWALGQIAAQAPQALPPVAKLVADSDAEVRAQAAKVLGEQRYAPAGESLVALLKDQSSRVRFLAAMSLGKLRHKPAVDALLNVLAENKEDDPILRHGVVMGLAGSATPEQLAARAADASGNVKIGALLALRRLGSPAIAAFLKDADEAVVLEAARAIHDVPIPDAMPALAALVGSGAIKNPHTLSRAVNANYRLGRAENAGALAAFASNASVSEPARKDALEALAAWGNPDAKDRLLNLWRPLPARPSNDAVAAVSTALPALLQSGGGGVQERAAQLAGKLGITTAAEPLAHLATNEGARSGARIAALQALASLKHPRLSDAATKAMAAKDAKVRSEALQALAGTDPAAAVKVIGDIINTGSVLEKQGALRALAQIKRPETTALVASLMDRLIGGELAPEIQLDVYETARRLDTPELKERMAKYKRSHPANDPMAPFKISLAGGDIHRGRKIFREKAEVQCLRCHKAEIGDSFVGPDLTKIGAEKDRQYLLESIVFPNKHIAQGFQTVTLMLKDNNVVAGRLLSEDASGVKVETIDEQGKPKAVTVAADRIAEKLSAPSPMPENIRDLLSRSELRDLVEYLATRK